MLLTNSNSLAADLCDICMGRFRGGRFRGLQLPLPPNGQSHSIKYSTIDVLSHADALIYIAKNLVVVVVMF